MNCKRCGSPLPSHGFVCTHCGVFMDKDQIEMQKSLQKDNIPKRVELVSEKYGGKKEIFQGREDTSKSVSIFFILLGILIFIIFIVFLVYFL